MSSALDDRALESPVDTSLRIALIAPPWLPVPPPAYGGTESVVHRLAVGLQRLGAEVTLVAHPESTCPVPRATAGTPSGHLGDRAEEARLAERAYRAIADLDVGLVHDHTLAGPLVAWRAGFTERLEVVTTSHGPFDEETERLLGGVDGVVPVIAISHAQASTARRVRPAAVIHHGIDAAEYPFGSGAGGYAVCLARMSPTKGLDVAIDVARRAGVPLRIAAKLREPDERDYFEQVIRPRLGGDVEYVGEVCTDDKRRLLADAVALLNPIRWEEPFGLAMVEALACGTPVLATPRGAAPEIVEHGRVGYLCADVPELVRALHRVDSIDRAACRRHVEERFTVERMAGAHARLYRQLLADRMTAAAS